MKSPLPHDEAIAPRVCMIALRVDRVIWQGDHRRAVGLSLDKGFNLGAYASGSQSLGYIGARAAERGDSLQGV
tara:strand:- start:7 stop:225 length:219 start_codon:yes stop_codon:yes gene_type:complete